MDSLPQSRCPTPTPTLGSPLRDLLVKDQPLKITMKCFRDMDQNDVWEIEPKAKDPRFEGVSVKRECPDSPTSPDMLWDQGMM